MEQKKTLKKTLKDLTLKDNFMFCAVMTVEENCRSFLEACLGFPIGDLQIDQEKSMIWHPEYRSVRLDVYAKDDENRRYNVEMQVAQKPFLAKKEAILPESDGHGTAAFRPQLRRTSGYLCDFCL